MYVGGEGVFTRVNPDPIHRCSSLQRARAAGREGGFRLSPTLVNNCVVELVYNLAFNIESASIVSDWI